MSRGELCRWFLATVPGPALRNARTARARRVPRASGARTPGSLRWVLGCWVRLRIRTVWGAPEAS